MNLGFLRLVDSCDDDTDEVAIMQSEKEADCFAAFQRKAELMVEVDALKLRMRESQV